LVLTIDRSTHKNPVKVRHGTSGVQVRFKIYVNCDPGDNPAQSDVCRHIGGNGNHPCRKCLVGGPQQVKETDIGFHSLFEVCTILFLAVITYRIEIFRPVFLVRLKGPFQMSSPKLN
jgi:hypothetical protein